MTSGSGRIELIEKGLVVVLFASLFFMLLLPISDPDFWWHLASGKWMWQNGALLNHDPFTMDLPFKSQNASGSFVLKQYWLAQLLFFGTYSLAGYSGIIILGAVVFTGMFLLMYLLLRQAGGGRLLGVAIICAAVAVIVREFGYVGIKPQMWSSLGAVAVIFLLEAGRRNERWAFPLLPLLMVIWANLHGGFILGDAIILLYLLGGLISRTVTGRGAMFCLGAVLASGLNPNGFGVLLSSPFVAQALGFLNIGGAGLLKEGADTIGETRSIFEHASIWGIAGRLPFFTGIMAVSLLSCVLNARRLFRTRPELLLLFILVFVMGVRSIRFIIFFTAIASYITVVNLGGLAETFRLSRFTLPRRGRSAALLALVMLMSTRFAAAGIATFPFGGNSPFHNEYEKAADFIRQNRLAGNLFNDYNAGGYLMWRLSPEVKIFIDGRVLYGQAFDIFRFISDAPLTTVPGHGSFYDYALRDFKIDFVLVPGCDAVSGTLIRLVPALLDDPGWAMVYADQNALFFVRNTPLYRDLIARHRAPTAIAYRAIYERATVAAKNGHAALLPNWKLSVAFAHAGLNDRQGALRWLGEYRAARPDDPFASDLQKRLLSKPELP